VAGDSGAIIYRHEVLVQISGDERYYDGECGQAANRTAVEIERAAA
jgi:hypothetical protein